METREEVNKIDILSQMKKMWSVIRKFWIPMLVVVLLIAGGNFIYSYKKYTPLYQSQATFTIFVEGRATTTGANAEQIKESLPYILNSSYMRNLVMEDLGINHFPASLELSSGEMTTFYVLKVNSQDAQMSYDIMNSVLEHCAKASRHVLGNTTVNILDQSTAPTSPINGFSKVKSMVTGLALGVVLCMAFAFVYSVTSKTIQTEEDLKKYLSVTCLSVIPQVIFKKHAKEAQETVHIHNSRVGYAFLENIRMLRARIQRSMDAMDAKVLMVTSSLPQEGKSTVAANVALALAEVGYSVILVDLDLRNPSIESVLGIKLGKKEGLAKVLSGNLRVERFISHISKWNLSILRAGEARNNPLELLGNEHLGNVIRVLRRNYDYVILDTPPAAILTDAAAVAKYADCSIYVVKQDYTRIARITEGLDQLSVVQIPILGVVLNGADKGMSNYAAYRYGAYEENNHKTEVEEEPEYIDMGNPWEK